MSVTPRFTPTAENMYVIAYDEQTPAEFDFAAILSASHACQRKGEVEKACNMRYEAFKRLIDLIPDEDEVVVDWEDESSRTALRLIGDSAIDHFLVGDFELASGMMEMLLDLDPEDHLEITKPLAYCYVALEEHDFFDEVINDISDKSPEKEILKMWSEFRKTGRIPEGELIHFKKNFPVYHKEFTAEEHPVSTGYLQEIESERPSKGSLAREMWLQTEHLWTQFPGFIEALKIH